MCNLNSVRAFAQIHRKVWGLTLITLFAVCSVWASDDEYVPIEKGTNFDARLDYNANHFVQPSSQQKAGLDFSRRSVPGLMTRFNEKTGATRILYNRGGYLTEATRSADLLSLALGFLHSNATVLGLESEDLQEYRIVDEVYTEVTGATRLHLQQVLDGIPVYNGQIQVNINRDGRIISVNNNYLPNLGNSMNAMSPQIDARTAVLNAARQVGLQIKGEIFADDRPVGVQQLTTVTAPGLSLEPMDAALMILPVRNGEAALVWNFQIQTLDAQHWYDFTVDAVTGEVWTRIDWTVSEQYDVYPLPNESPNHTSPLPPSDGRQLVGIPNPATSPLGWHDTGSTSYTIMRGNNVHAYDDKNNSNSPPSSQPNCGSSLDCIFPMNLNNDPDTYVSAAVANLFYTNNLIHDITYVYGFDEAGGNFQVNNFGNGGNGNDDVRAEAQDGGGTNNANMATPSDGSRPRMQMYLWNQTNPRRDGDLDNGIIVHEYGHGISNRLVGGPGASSCLGNTQQPGEGLSDWWALAYTHEVGDSGTDARGIGTYALGQPVTGAGIRTQRYSTDPGINTHTYQSIRNMVVPHGVGEVWAQGAWKCYWALVDEYGFDANLYDAFGGAGNQRMMLYVVEGLKNTSCSPTFADVRDGIIQAATDNYNGDDVCLLWNTFASFGLGIDANDASSGSLQVTNGFTTAPECGGTLPTIVGINTVHSQSTTTANRRSMPFTMPEDGTISSVTMYHEAGSGQMILGIYEGASTPTNRLAVTPSTSVSGSAGWQTINLTSPIFVSGGTQIWLSWVYENNPGIRYTSGSPGRVDAGVGWTGGMPDPFGSSTQANFLYSIYSDYTPGSGTQYSLTTATNGSGSVSLSPSGGTYNEGTVVQATATPAAGWQFDSWSGDASGSSNPVSVTMNANKSITANFSQIPQYTLTTNTVGSGSVSLSPSGGTYQSGTVVTVTANPAAGWAFSGWSGDLSGSTNPESITMDSNKSVTATFVAVATYSLTTNTVGSGSISLNPAGGTYNDGTVVTVTANPNSGNAFTGWSGDLSGSTNPTTITMDSNKSITATFEAADATVGNTAVFGSVSTAANRRAMPFTMPEDGTISSVSMYHEGGSGGMILAVYDGSASAPGALLGTSASTTVSGTAGWQTLSLQTAVPVSGGSTIWLAWVYQSNPGIRYQTGSPGRADAGVGWSGGMPATYGSSTQANFLYSIYANYTPGALPTGTVGNTAVFGSSTTTANRRAMPYTMPQDGTITSISMYHQAGSGSMILAVYDGVSGNRLGTTGSTAVSGTTGWQTINLTSPAFVSSGTEIWLAWVYESNPGISYQTGTPGRYDAGVGWPGGMPATYGASTQADFIYSIYATFDTGGAPIAGGDGSSNRYATSKSGEAARDD